MFFHSLQNSKGKLLPVGAKILFTTSIYAAADIIVKPIMIYHEKMILIHETIYNDPLIIEAFGDNSKRKLAKILMLGDMRTFDKFGDYEHINYRRKLAKILMLGDMRTFDKFGDYEHINYRRKLNFDIWKPLEGFIKHRTMLNMSTEHKCYENGYLQDLMRFYGGDYLIYTRPKYFKSYSLLKSGSVDVEISPINNFMNQWDTTIYLNSKRGQDPSPRIIAECKFYNKILIWHRPGEYKDGAYFRNIDVLNGLDGLKLKNNDKIFKIVDRYL